MSVNTKRGPIIDPGMCRCCGVMKKCRLLDVEYDHMGKKEVYSDMMMDCFGLLLCSMDGENKDRLVCATCVVRLREALSFRMQVLRCEEAFLLKIHKDDEIKVKVEIKTEDCPEDNESVRDYDQGTDNMMEEEQYNEMDNTKLLDVKVEIKERIDTKLQELKEKRLAKKKVEHLRMKKDLLRKMQRLKCMLQQKLKKPANTTPPKLKVVKQPRAMSPERMTHHNRITVVENSYVCPFKNRISNYYCYYCKDIFTDCNELRQHTLSHDPKVFENFTEQKRIPKIDITRIDCRLCSEKIDSISEFKTHISSVHKKNIYSNVTNEFLEFRLTMDNLSCLECDKQFLFIDKLIDHLTDHFGKYVCDICGSCFIEEGTLSHHMRGHKKVDTNFPCEVCGKNLKTNYSRQLHIATVHEKRPIVGCYKCEASFLSYAQRNRHLINVHGDRRKFPCKSCDKVFDVRKTLMEHRRKYHLQGCRHQCDVCEQRFFTPSELKEHKTCHTGERNYICEYCDKSYPRRQSLLDHIRSHTNDRRYKCNICHSTFTQNGSLKSHIKSQHQGFELDGFHTLAGA